MAAVKNLKNYVTVSEFAAQIGVSKEMVSKMKRTGTIPAENFEKSGRQGYVHTKNAIAALKVAPVGDKGKAPVWAAVVGNKAGIAKAKRLAGGDSKAAA